MESATSSRRVPPLPPRSPATADSERRAATIANPERIRAARAAKMAIQQDDSRQVARALAIISQSLEPPVHRVDLIIKWVREQLGIPTESVGDGNDNGLVDGECEWVDQLIIVGRALWHYLFLQGHLIYNLALLYATFLTTPPVVYFILGLTLFWMRILYEIYRDIMHRDDPVYSSNVPKEMSIAAAISASLGFVLRIKAENGDIDESWWTG